MKKLGIKFATCLLLAAAAAGVQATNIISWHDSNGNTIPATGVAGVALATNWNNSNPGNGGGIAALLDNTNVATTAGFTVTGTYGGWGIGAEGGPDGDGTYNRSLLGGYANTSSGVSGGVEVFSITGIPYSTYNIIAYFSSDTANRTGTIGSANAGITYDFSTIGPPSVSGASAVLTQTTDTTAANPVANYAVFTNLTGSSETLTLSIPNGGGMAGFQIVNTGTVTNTLSLVADTTVSPTNTVYVGASVTLSALFSGTQPITNQWKVDKGSGFVPITGATNTTLTLSNIQLSNSGNYVLFASNAAGSSNSTPATLTVYSAPSQLSINVQFTGSWLDGNAPTQTGPAVIGNSGDFWNGISNPTGGTSPAGLAQGTNIALLDVTNVAAGVTMDYVADYIFSGAFDPGVNPFVAAGSPVAPLMTGYMGSVSTSGSADTNTVTLHHLSAGSYDLYLFVCGRSDGQGRIDVLTANGQSAVCGPNNNNNTLMPGVNYVHLTPLVAGDGVLKISMYGTTDNGQGLMNGIQLFGPVTTPTLFLSSDTSCDSPATNYAGRNITLKAAFSGFPTPTLQWMVNKGSGFVNVSAGATNASLTLSNAGTTDTGSYALYASNIVGTSNSTPFSIVVLPAPTTNFGINVNAQFDGTTFTGSHATPQVGPAVVGNAGDYWNPVSNPNPVGGDTNRILGSILGLLDATGIGTSYNLSYLADEDYNSGVNTPFTGSGSPAEDLMQAALLVIDGLTGSVSLTGLQAGRYDLYLYSSEGSTLQTTVTRFAANDSFDTAGPNNGNNVLAVEQNYVLLTPMVDASGVLNISLAGVAEPNSCLNGIQLSGPGAASTAPLAGFALSVPSAYIAQGVVFTDVSSGNITNWVWNYGDGISSTNTSEVNPTHAYSTPGTYNVGLTVKGPAGSSSSNLVAAVTVVAQPIMSAPVLSSGSLTLNGTGGMPSTQYRILTSTNLTIPLASWTPIVTNTFAGDGSYSFTTTALTDSASFFLLVTP
jgi:PKD repeat protein